MMKQVVFVFALCAVSYGQITRPTTMFTTTTSTTGAVTTTTPFVTSEVTTDLTTEKATSVTTESTEASTTQLVTSTTVEVPTSTVTATTIVNEVTTSETYVDGLSASEIGGVVAGVLAALALFSIFLVYLKRDVIVSQVNNQRLYAASSVEIELWATEASRRLEEGYASTEGTEVSLWERMSEDGL